MALGFTPSHRGGSGSPLVCLHGFLDTWRTWELMLPTLERSHDVLAPTLPGHAGGPPIPDPLDTEAVVDVVEHLLDDAGFETAHLVGNSLGGYVALRLAARGRARSVVALAPAGGWAVGDRSADHLLDRQRDLLRQVKLVVPFTEALLSTRAGRRRATELTAVRYLHIPTELLSHQVRGVAGCTGAEALIANGRREGWSLDAEAITCPVRIVWGSADRILPWPSAAVRYREEWLPHADWVELDDVGHCPQLDVPLETAQLVLGVTAG